MKILAILEKMVALLSIFHQITHKIADVSLKKTCV
jgi:hypothetical protein